MPLPPLPSLIDRAYDYSSFQAANPSTPLPASRIETDYDALFDWTTTARAWMASVSSTLVGDAAADAAAAAASAAAAATSATNAAASATSAAASAASAASRVSRTGDTMTGPLILSADPTDPLGASTKQYVDAAAAGGALKVSKTGDTMTGALALVAPTADAHGARRRDLPAEWLRTSATIAGNPIFIEFVLDDTFDAFHFECVGLGPTTTDCPLVFQLSTNGGSTWISGATDYFWGSHGVNSAGITGAPAVGSGLGLLTFNQQLSATLNLRCDFRLSMPATSGHHEYRADFTGATSTGWYGGYVFGGLAANTARANRIRFAFNTTTFQNRGSIIQRGVRR